MSHTLPLAIIRPSDSRLEIIQWVADALSMEFSAVVDAMLDSTLSVRAPLAQDWFMVYDPATRTYRVVR